MTELFQPSKQNVSLIVNNIFKEFPICSKGRESHAKKNFSDDKKILKEKFGLYYKLN